jgi:hypothetical protein
LADRLRLFACGDLAVRAGCSSQERRSYPLGRLSAAILLDAA